MKVYYKVLDGHTHITIFTGKLGTTLGCAGDITMTNEEFDSWKNNQVLLEFTEGLK